MKITFALLFAASAVLISAAPAPAPIAEPNPQYGNYGQYGAYGQYQNYPQPSTTSSRPTPTPTGYGSYSNYGTYRRLEAEAEVVEA